MLFWDVNNGISRRSWARNKEANFTITRAMKMNPDLKKIEDVDDNHKALMAFSKVLEGMHRHASTHAAGVVITPGPLTDYVPLFKNPRTGDITTQLEMNSLEALSNICENMS